MYGEGNTYSYTMKLKEILKDKRKLYIITFFHSYEKLTHLNKHYSNK
jgi:hypothetical protein